MIAAARANLEEAAHSLRSYAARSEADPARLEQIDGAYRSSTGSHGSTAAALKPQSRH